MQVRVKPLEVFEHGWTKLRPPAGNHCLAQAPPAADRASAETRRVRGVSELRRGNALRTGHHSPRSPELSAQGVAEPLDPFAEHESMTVGRSQPHLPPPPWLVVGAFRTSARSDIAARGSRPRSRRSGTPVTVVPELGGRNDIGATTQHERHVSRSAERPVARVGVSPFTAEHATEPSSGMSRSWTARTGSELKIFIRQLCHLRTDPAGRAYGRHCHCRRRQSRVRGLGPTGQHS